MKDYYKLFGLGRSASDADIGEAYRRLVRQTHPDAARTADHTAFIEVQEAWEAIGTPQRRRDYDRALCRQRQLQRLSQLVRVRPHPAQVRRRAGVPAALWDKPTALYVREVYVPRMPDVDLVLDPLEAAHGGPVPLAVAIPVRCTACQGWGRTTHFVCRVCRGVGMVERRLVLPVYVPPQARDGLVTRVPLRRFGMAGCSLLVRLRVAEQD